MSNWQRIVETARDDGERQPAQARSLGGYDLFRGRDAESNAHGIIIERDDHLLVVLCLGDCTTEQAERVFLTLTLRQLEKVLSKRPVA